MKLDDNGTAFFVEDVNSESEDEDIPPELATSPIPSQSYMELARPKFPSAEGGGGGEGGENKKANRSLIGEFNAIEEKESSAAEKEEDDENVSELSVSIHFRVELKHETFTINPSSNSGRARGAALLRRSRSRQSRGRRRGS